MANVAVLGGAGFLGSHCSLLLLQAGHAVTIVDNLANSSPQAVERIERLAGRRLRLVAGDIRDKEVLYASLAGADGVIHFAALKSVAESVRQPLEYYENNVAGTISVLRAASELGVRRLVFSSSATVYDAGVRSPVNEQSPVKPITPYGRTKLVCEDMIRDYCSANPSASAVLLRYFNPVGAHPSGQLGESPNGEPNNLMPIVCGVAAGRRPFLDIFGSDYPTRDGTGVRDYVHVMDLASAHLAALQFLMGDPGTCSVFNVGTGVGYSVLELVTEFERVNDVEIRKRIGPRRDGDVAELWSDPSAIRKSLDWAPTRGLDQMCADSWRWECLGQRYAMASVLPAPVR